MAKAAKHKPRPIVARERIYPSGVFKNTLAILTSAKCFAGANPDHLRFLQRHIDLETKCFSPLGYFEHQLKCLYLDVVPRRELMFNWVQGLLMHMIGEAAQIETSYRPVVIPFLIDPSLGSGIGYLTRSSITPQEFHSVVVRSLSILDELGDDIVFSRYYPKPHPVYFEPTDWPPDVILVDVDPDR
jgi:hypothetical protein